MRLARRHRRGPSAGQPDPDARFHGGRARSRARAREGRVRLEDARRARARALRARARGAQRRRRRARAAWEKQRERLPEADRLYGNARIAYHAARQLHPRANDWYREAAGAPLNDAQHAWRVRAALRAGAWSDVEAAIAAMPRAQAQEPAWRYWKARALAATGTSDDAKRDLRGARRRIPFLRPARGGSARAAHRAGQRSGPPVAGGARAVRRAAGHPPRGEAGRARHAAPNRSANGSTSCAGATTKACCSPPTTRAASGSTTARSTPRSERRSGTISDCAT